MNVVMKCSSLDPKAWPFFGRGFQDNNKRKKRIICDDWILHCISIRLLFFFLLALLLFACTDVEINQTVVDRRKLPEKIDVILWGNQNHHFTVETKEALLHLSQLKPEMPQVRNRSSLTYFVDPNMDKFGLDYIDDFFTILSSATNMDVTKVKNKNERIDIAIVSTSRWRDQRGNAVDNSKNVRDPAAKWYRYGCSYYGHVSGLAHSEVKPTLGVIEIDEDLAQKKETDRFSHGALKYTHSMKCVGSSILMALGFSGTASSFPSITTQYAVAPKDPIYTEYDYAALKLYFVYLVDVGDRVQTIKRL